MTDDADFEVTLDAQPEKNSKVESDLCMLVKEFEQNGKDLWKLKREDGKWEFHTVGRRMNNVGAARTWCHRWRNEEEDVVGSAEEDRGGEEEVDRKVRQEKKRVDEDNDLKRYKLEFGDSWGVWRGSSNWEFKAPTGERLRSVKEARNWLAGQGGQNSTLQLIADLKAKVQGKDPEGSPRKIPKGSPSKVTLGTPSKLPLGLANLLGSNEGFGSMLAIGMENVKVSVTKVNVMGATINHHSPPAAMLKNLGH